ncbi:uncharacterized protein LOC115163476 isoform X1 [Salmo trutta]|uniref:uncharacterized protein LOC115163476 isoform X1 n=1 Tax=Salmo trutta TaxID=8032 RepID=UPI001130DEDB|nr:uncharacterized protein LOC115163476 isoform X1 [Salmo trutta]
MSCLCIQTQCTFSLKNLTISVQVPLYLVSSMQIGVATLSRHQGSRTRPSPPTTCTASPASVIGPPAGPSSNSTGGGGGLQKPPSARMRFQMKLSSHQDPSRPWQRAPLLLPKKRCFLVAKGAAGEHLAWRLPWQFSLWLVWLL